VNVNDEPTGPTKNDNWEVGVRVTVAAPLHAVWDFLLGAGLGLWLGSTTLTLEKGAAYRTTDGVAGEIRSVTERQKIKLSWHPDDWPHDTILQVTVKEVADGTTIGFRHEQLADRDERHMMVGHWKNVVAELAKAIEGN
jgi:uncharacterized protein YndB with AHSA1/START domain